MLRQIFSSILLLTLCCTTQASASLISMEVSGTFGSGVALDNTTDLSNVPFTYRAQFDSSVNTGTPPGNLVSPTTLLEFTINSVTYTGASSYVYLDATNPITPSTPYTAGLSDENQANWHYFMGNYDTISTPFNAAAPQNSILSGAGVDNSTGGLSLTFTGGTTISNLSFDSGAATAAISTTAVPEPSTYALLCLGLGVVGYAKRKLVQRGT